VRPFPAVALGALLALATALRFTGLGWGLRHPPAIDEYYFVSSTVEMMARGDIDHRFHEYPALLFYLLAGTFRLLGRHEADAAAYLAARALFAAFGVASVALTWRLARPLVGEWPALFAAALVAVSPLEVRTAHMIRPDVVLEAFSLAALIAFRERGAPKRDDAIAGAALGAATAVKFSGVLLGPSYALERFARPGRRGPGIAVAVAAALGTFAVLSPPTWRAAADARSGIAGQIAFHYAGVARSWPGMAADYGVAFLGAVGLAAAVLAAAGLALGLREGRRWWSLAAFPLVTIAVFATANVVRRRFLVPTLGVLAVFAALALARLPGRRSLRVLAALAVLAVPLAHSVRYLRDVTVPGPRDEAADWLDAHAPTGARVVNTAAAALGLEPRLEVLRVDALDERAWLAARDADFVVTGALEDRRLVRQLSRVHVFRPVGPDVGGPVAVLAVPASLRRSYETVPLTPGLLAASQAEGLARLCDGDAATAWRADGEAGGAWLQVAFREPVELARVELRPAEGEPRVPGLSLAASDDGRHWTSIAAVAARPAPSRQVGRRSQVLVFEPVRTRWLRLMPSRAGPWAIAELRLDALSPPPPS
jgi:4-amino-4-deoxy-L-arabinose transferase-like glycosyltransferase